MLPCNSQNEIDALRYLVYALEQNSEYQELRSRLIEGHSPENCSFYNFASTDAFFATYKKSKSVNWKIEGF
jgi:hypothetical protein